jgi:hypothetical protein
VIMWGVELLFASPEELTVHTPRTFFWICTQSRFGDLTLACVVAKIVIFLPKMPHCLRHDLNGKNYHPIIVCQE